MIRTPDQRLRVFVSSTLGELAEERRAVSRAASNPVTISRRAGDHAWKPNRSLNLRARTRRDPRWLASIERRSVATISAGSLIAATTRPLLSPTMDGNPDRARR